MVYAIFPSVSNRDGTKRFHYVISLNSRFQRINEILTQTSIINTLAIGVYFSVITALDTGYWDGLQSALISGGCGGSFHKFYNTTRNIIVAGITSGCIAVIITFLYYFKPPQDKNDCVVIKVNDFPVTDDRGIAVQPTLVVENFDGSSSSNSNPLQSETHDKSLRSIELNNRGGNSGRLVDGILMRDSNLLAPNARREFEAAWEEFTLDYIEYLEAMGYIAVFCTYVSIVCFIFLLWSLYDKFSVPSSYICTNNNFNSITTGAIIFGIIACISLCAMKIGYGTELFPRWAERVGLKATPYYRIVNFAAYVLLHFAFLFTPIFILLYLLY